MKYNNLQTGFIRHSAGFTLIELLVSISIMVIMLSVILVNYHRFDSTFTTTNLAYDVALSVRKAQSDAVSVHSITDTTGVSSFQFGYGVHFDSKYPTQYVIFADNSTSGTKNYFDGTMSLANGTGSTCTANIDSCVETYNLPASYSISNICIYSGSQSKCWSDGSIQSLDITFKRPNPDANIFGYSNPTSFNSSVFGSVGADKAVITIVSPDSAVQARTITVQTTGQISVQ